LREDLPVDPDLAETMIRSHLARWSFPTRVFSLSIVFFAGPVIAQQQPTREELRGLQKQIDDVRETQKAILKELREIKNFLQGRAAQPNLPPPNLTVRVDGSPFKGKESAKLTLIEFSDYQCPFCARHFRETLPQIERDYVKTDKLRYVFRDFPIESIHREAFKAHEAANYAGEQGRYWEMHDRLFQNQNQLGAAELPKHAEAIGLNLPAFQQCLNSAKQAGEIRKDLEDGQKAGVNGTPTFFLGLQEADGKTIKVLRTILGAQPYAQFKQAIEGALNQMKK